MIKIKIGDEYLDGGGIIAQTYEVNDLGQIETRQGGFSNTFNLPLSNKNKRLLGYSDNVNAYGRLPYRRIDAQLYDNNTRVATGYLKIVRTLKDGFECVFFSDNVTWFSLLKDKKLSDLDLSSLDHAYTRANIITSFSATSGYIYPVIDYGLFVNRAALEADVTEMYPAVFVKTIVDQLFKDIGWVATGEMFDEPIYDRMILPFANEEFTRSEADIIDETQSDIITTAVPSVGDAVNILSVTAGIASLFTLDIQVVIDDLILSDSDSLTLNVNVNSFSIASYADITANGTYNLKIENVNIAASDVIDIQTEFIGAGAPGADNFTLEVTSSLIATPAAQISETNTISVAATLPDISQTDFLKYLFNFFGVVPTADPLSKIVSLDLFKNINKRLDQAVDWSAKIDVSEEIETDFEELIDGYGQRSIFKYLDDEDDELLQTYKSANGILFGEGHISIDNQHLPGTVDIYEAPFSSSINFLSYVNTIYIPQIIKRIPRIMLVTDAPVSVSELTGGAFANFTVTSAVSGSGTAASIPFAWFAKAPYTVTTNGYLDSLSFGDITFTSNVEGSLTNYWNEYQEALNDIKYVRAFFRLDSVDIQNLDFTKPVYISYFNAYFYLNKILEYTGKDQVTEVELIKIG